MDGNDLFIWNNGDGSDFVAGDTGERAPYYKIKLEKVHVTSYQLGGA